MRFKSQIPGEAAREDSLSFRRRCLAQGMCKGGDHESRNESSNQTRITSAHATAVSRGIDGQEEEQTA